MPRLTRNRVTQALVVATWLVGVTYSFWWFFLQNISAFDSRGIYTQQLSRVNPVRYPELLNQLKTKYSDEQLVIHWLDATCSCFKFSVSEIQRQIDNAPSGVQHLLVYKGNLRPKNEVLADVPVVDLTEQELAVSQSFIPASPAVSILTKDSPFYSYLGPHSSGLLCGTGKSFVDFTLNNLSTGFDPQLMNVMQTGCYCNW